MRHLLTGLCILAVIMAVNTGSASAQIISNLFISDTLPECDHPKVESKIRKRFAKAEEKQWHHGIALGAVRDKSLKRVEWTTGKGISRRYCHAHADMSDGHTRTVHYVIEQDMGFAGYGWNVEFCIGGFDRWMTYDGYCRSIR